MRTIVVMPAWNEADVIAPFLRDIDAALASQRPEIVVVDDRSTDGTAAVVAGMTELASRPTVISNEVNLGHGPSTLHALRLGLASGADVIVAVDGDAQFTGADILRVITEQRLHDCDVVEGVRHDRSDPLYRRLVSTMTRTLVLLRVGVRPADANTPLRAYRPEALRLLLSSLPADSQIPNLFISAASRRLGMSIREVPVTSLPRRSLDPTRTSWGAIHPKLPSRRFVSFCGRTAVQWFTTPLAVDPFRPPKDRN
jgi:glycosyltransferase involved in cell wall biosynthesis